MPKYIHVEDLQHKLEEDHWANVILSVGEANIVDGLVYYFTGDKLFKIEQVTSGLKVKSLGVIGETRMVSFNGVWLEYQTCWGDGSLFMLKPEEHVYLEEFLIRELLG